MCCHDCLFQAVSGCYKRSRFNSFHNEKRTVLNCSTKDSTNCPINKRKYVENISNFRIQGCRDCKVLAFRSYNEVNHFWGSIDKARKHDVWNHFSKHRFVIRDTVHVPFLFLKISLKTCTQIMTLEEIKARVVGGKR